MQKNSVKNKQENTFSNTFWVGFSRQRFPVTRSRAAAVRYVFVDQQGSETSHTQTLISIYQAGRYHGDCLFCFCFLTSTSSVFHCGRATLHYRRAADWELKPLEMHGPVRQTWFFASLGPKVLPKPASRPRRQVGRRWLSSHLVTSSNSPDAFLPRRPSQIAPPRTVLLVWSRRGDLEPHLQRDIQITLRTDWNATAIGLLGKLLRGREKIEKAGEVSGTWQWLWLWWSILLLPLLTLPNMRDLHSPSHTRSLRKLRRRPAL